MSTAVYLSSKHAISPARLIALDRCVARQRSAATLGLVCWWELHLECRVRHPKAVHIHADGMAPGAGLDVRTHKIRWTTTLSTAFGLMDSKNSRYSKAQVRGFESQ